MNNKENGAEHPPLSFGQQALWFFSAVEGGGASYNMPCAFRIRGDLDPERLLRALRSVAERHEVLRTSYPTSNGAPYQLVHSSEQLDMAFTDLIGTPQDRLDKELDILLAEEVHRRFDLRTGPLLRAHLVRTSATEHVFSVVLHHIATDGWSFRVIFDEISRVYNSLTAGDTPEQGLPELPVQFADYALWQRDWLSGTTLKKRLDRWESMLSGAEEIQFPGTSSRETRPSWRSGRILTSLDKSSHHSLVSMCDERRTSLLSALTSAFAVALLHFSRQEDLVFGTVLSGRVEAELEHLVGYFANLVPLRVDLSGDPRFDQLLPPVEESLITAMDEEVPFPSIVGRLEPRRVPGRNPVCQTSVQLLDEWSGCTRLSLSGTESQPVNVYQGHMALDLALTFTTSSDGLRAQLEYATEVFPTEWAERFTDAVMGVLSTVGANPGVRVSKIVDIDDHHPPLPNTTRNGAEP